MLANHKRRPVMSSAQLRELEEIADRARDDPSMRPVSMSMAVLAVAVAIVSLGGHIAHTEEILKANEVTNGWAHYQAKSSRGHESAMFADLAGVLGGAPNAATLALQAKYQREAGTYKHEKDDLYRETKNYEDQLKTIKSTANGYDVGEILLEIALVITSITLLSGGKIYWYAGMLFGAAGIIVAASAWYGAGCAGSCALGWPFRFG